MSTLSPAQLQELKQAVSSSLRCERLTRVPAELTVAQWALESGWGIHQPGNNCFGIKAYHGCYGIQSLQTIEVVKGVRLSVKQDFATFPSLDACFEKHADLFTAGKPYAQAWLHYRQSADLKSFIRQIAPLYATAPHYGETLIKIVSMPEVASCLTESRKAG